MTGALVERLLALDAIVHWSILAKVTALLLLGLVAVQCAPRASASTRHMVLLALLATALLLPIPALLLDPWTIELTSTQPAIADASYSGDTPPTASSRTPVGTVSRQAAARGSRRATMTNALVAVWLLGCVVWLMSLAYSSRRIGRLRREAIPTLRCLVLGRDVAALIGVTRPIDVLLHEDARVPSVCGVRRPFVLLPLNARDWSDADIRRALLHEFEHVRRHDVLTSWIGHLACAVYWFHPLVWKVWRRMQLEAERACDDVVVAGAGGADYAAQLVALAARLTSRDVVPGVPMATSELSVRVSAILSTAQRRDRLDRRVAIGTSVAALLLMLVVAPLRAVPAFVPPRAGVMALQAPAPVGPGARPAFAAAVVKRNTDPDGPRAFSATPGRVRLINQTVHQLIGSAYQIQAYQIVGGPNWLSSDRYDIEAVADASATPPQMLLMVRALLADRFHLVMRAERRELPIFRLTHARDDHRLGPGVRVSVCRPVTAGDAPAPPAVPCGNQVGQGRMALRGNTMGGLANALGRLPVVGRPVVDVTALTDTLDIELTWTPEAAERNPVTAPALVETTSIFTALQEQLGLRLESAKGLVDVLVIDSVDRPSEN